MSGVGTFVIACAKLYLAYHYFIQCDEPAFRTPSQPLGCL